MRTNILLTIALIAAMMLAGCAKEESDMEQFTIDMEQISILAGEDYKVTPSGAFTARSTDEDVATVSAEGVIHGVSAGEADVIFTAAEGGQTQTCKVSVDWKYKYFEEPILDFSLSMEQLRAMEKHAIVFEDKIDLSPVGYADAPDPYLIRFSYPDQEIPMFVNYCFADKSQQGLCLITTEEFKLGGLAQEEKIRQQLTERYGNPTEANDYFAKFESAIKHLKIRHHSPNISYEKSE